MLGEAALTQPDAERYLQAYKDAIAALGQRGPFASVLDAPSISVKLSALHPRYEVAKRARVHAELTPKLLELAQLAKRNGIGLTVDAEEADRLELSLDVIGAVFADPSLEGWDGYGLAVQAYQKRAPFVIDWLAETARAAQRRWCVRLVKGAYWDSEIKRAQEGGFAGYPVFTRKPNTDVSYLACAAPVRGRQRCDLSAVRDPQRAHDRGDPSSRAGTPVRIPAPARHGHRPLRRSHRQGPPRRALPRVRAGRLRTRTCCRTWCVACSKTAPTPRSSTASSTRTSPSTSWSPIRCETVRAFAADRIRASRCRSISTRTIRRIQTRSPGRIPWASTSPTTTN